VTLSLSQWNQLLFNGDSGKKGPHQSTVDGILWGKAPWLSVRALGLWLSRLLLLFLLRLGLELRVQMSRVLTKQALYNLSHTSSPVCSGYFRDGGLTRS
jgi:hypothetical protein